MTHLPPEAIAALKMVLSGKKLVSFDEVVETQSALSAGHVRAVLGTMKKLGIDQLLSTRIEADPG